MEGHNSSQEETSRPSNDNDSKCPAANVDDVSLTSGETTRDKAAVPCDKPLPPVPHEGPAGDGSTSAGEEEVHEQLCPKVNCTEKIIICLDLSSEMESMTFRTKSGNAFPPSALVKRALGIFMKLKKNMDSSHEYALILLREQALWMANFTTDPSKIVTLLEELHYSFEVDSLNMTSVFDTIAERIGLMPEITDVETVPPPYTVRVLFVYGRNHCMPQFKNKQSFRKLMLSPYFFFDAFYIHEPASDDNKCEEIYDYICDLDENGHSYIFEVARNPTKLYDNMALFLAHPLQRPLQRDINNKIDNLGLKDQT